MRRKIGKTGKRTAVCAVSAALLFSSMNLDILAADVNGLPSAGIDFFLSSNATSVKSLKEDEGEVKSSSEKKESDGLSESEEDADAKATATMSPTATPSPTEEPEKEPEEDIVIEETMMASTTKSVNQIERKLEAKREEKGFKSLVIADVNDYVNVRSMPSEEGEILGKLYDESVGEFISEKDGWYEITSGSVTGYVKAEYCVTGDDAVDLAKKVGTRIATVTTTTLKVREEPGMDAVVLGLVPIEDQLLVTEELDGWVKVDIEEGFGYVSTDYVTLSTEFVKAESKAEEEARLAKEAAERRAAQAAAAKASRKSSSSSGSAPAPVIRRRKRAGSGSCKLRLPVCGKSLCMGRHQPYKRCGLLRFRNERLQQFRRQPAALVGC